MVSVSLVGISAQCIMKLRKFKLSKVKILVYFSDVQYTIPALFKIHGILT